METKKINVKDFFLNLGATVALYTVVVSLLNLLFTIINNVYPKITNGYQYFGSTSIAWPVAVLIIFFPIFIALQWVMAKEYSSNPENKSTGIHKWLTYLTLFIAGLVLAGDLITVLYYFIDGQELTTGFLLKVLSILVVTGCLFVYYISDIKGRLTPQSRMIWRVVASVIVLGSIVWGFAVLGSPATQRLYKYDTAKVNDLSQLRGAIENHYYTNEVLPETIDSLDSSYYVAKLDSQTQKPYEYRKVSNLEYELCADFNLSSKGTGNQVPEYMYMNENWDHEIGRTCFTQKINPNLFRKI